MKIRELTPLFSSEMVTGGNFFHRLLLKLFASKVQLEGVHLEEIHAQALMGPIIYVAPAIGHVEYNVFADLCHKQDFPLAQFNNILKTKRWLPFRQKRERRRRRKELLKTLRKVPDPIASGYFKSLLNEGDSFLLSLEKWDPSYTAGDLKNLFRHLLDIKVEVGKPVAIVPCQMIWDKRPKPLQPSLLHFLFGENERPGRLRKWILLFRHIRKRAVVQFGKPILLEPFQQPEELHQKIVRSFKSDRRTLTGPPLRPRHWFLETIREDEELSKLIYALSKEKQKPVETFKKLAEKYAKEIVGEIRYSFVEFASALLHWFFRLFFGRFHTNKEDWKNLKSCLGRGPCVLVPNHRSHIDYLLLSYLCTLNNIAVPFIAAGQNLAFWPLGSFFRRGGAFFLRREFKGNALYKQVFQTYLKILLREGYLQEFFIEGGRSRTGKLRNPRFGMLTMYSDLMAQNAAPDLQFLPVSITYDRIPEEKSYVEEEEGKPKLKEKFFDLLKLTKIFRQRYGSIYISIDQPISWQELNSKTEGTGWEEKRAKLVRSLADRISYSINRQVVLTPKALAATALLWSGKPGMTLTQAEQSYLMFLDYARWKEGKLSQTLQTHPKGALLEALHQFEAAGAIRRHQGTVGTFFEIPSKRRSEIHFFKNFSIHRFVSISLFCNLLRIAGSTPIALRELADDYSLFQKLFFREFRFSTQRTLHEHLSSLYQYLYEKRAIAQEGDFLLVRPTGQPMLRMFSNILRNFLEGYGIAWTVSVMQPAARQNQKEFSKALLKLAREQLILGKIRYPEGISQTIFENAVQSLNDLGWLTLETEEAKRTRQLLDRFLAMESDEDFRPPLQEVRPAKNQTPFGGGRPSSPQNPDPMAQSQSGGLLSQKE